MANQTRIWTDPKVIAERRARVEAYMGRKLELPGDKPAKTTPQRKRKAA